MQEFNAELVKNLSAHFPLRKDASYAWGQAVGGILLTPGLRAFYPTSSYDEDGNVYDLSGQGRTLAIYGGSLGLSNGIVPYLELGGVVEYLYRPTEPGLEFNKDIAVWTWAYFNPGSTGAFTSLISKWGLINNYSYLLDKFTDDHFYFGVSPDGIATLAIDDTTATAYAYAPNQWYFLAGRLTHSAELALFVGIASDGSYYWYKQAAGVPAGIYAACVEDLRIGADSSPAGDYLNGRMSLFGLSSLPISDTQIWNIFTQTRPLFL